MTAAYHVTGLISAVIFLLTLGGLWSQLGLIFERKRNFEKGDLPSGNGDSLVEPIREQLSGILRIFSLRRLSETFQPLPGLAAPGGNAFDPDHTFRNAARPAGRSISRFVYRLRGAPGGSTRNSSL